jgi:3-(3-hydroxy-phenyl)propionate hydroxylase
MPSYDVVIAGYGPTGAIAANLLGAAGLRVLLVDPSPEIYDIPRAVHIDGEVMRILQSLGMSSAVDEVAAEADGTLKFLNGRGWVLHTQDMANLERTNGWAADTFINQPGLEKQLREGVARFPNVELRLGWQLETLQQSADGVEVTLRHVATAQEQLIDCEYFLGCDGAGSNTRTALGIELETLDCDEPWLVCDLVLDEPDQHSRDVYQFCDPARPATLVPCEGPHIRWEFMLDASDDIAHLENEATARALMAPHMHRLSPMLNEHSGKLIRSKVYHFHALLAQNFQSGRVFLLGDAAHQTPPFLGQGLCAGVRDAHNLCWKLTGVIRGLYGSSVLDTYTSERKPHVHEVISTAVSVGSVIQARNPVKALLRDSYLLLGKLFPPLVGFLQFGFRWYLGPGLLACEGAPPAKGAVGFPMPQPVVKDGSGESVRLDYLLGSGFALVGFGLDPADWVSAGPLELECVQVGGGGLVEQGDGMLSRWAHEHAISIALIRPDRQVYGICNGRGGEEVSNELATLLARLNAQLGFKTLSA